MTAPYKLYRADDGGLTTEKSRSGSVSVEFGVGLPFPATVFPMPDALRALITGKGEQHFSLGSLAHEDKLKVYGAVRESLEKYVGWLNPYVTQNGVLGGEYAEMPVYEGSVGFNNVQMAFTKIYGRLEHLLCGAALTRTEMRSRAVEGCNVFVVDTDADIRQVDPRYIKVGDMEVPVLPLSAAVGSDGSQRKAGQLNFPNILPFEGDYRTVFTSDPYGRLIISMLTGALFQPNLVLPLNDAWNPRLRFACDDDYFSLSITVFDPTRERLQRSNESLDKLMEHLKQKQQQQALIEGALLYWNIDRYTKIARNLFATSTPANFAGLLSSEALRSSFSVRKNIEALNGISSGLQQSLPLELRAFYEYLGESN